MKFIFSLLVVILITLHADFAAAEENIYKDYRSIPSILREKQYFHPRQSEQRYLDRILNLLKVDGATQLIVKDFEKDYQQQLSKEKVQRIVSFDSNRDTNVTREELTGSKTCGTALIFKQDPVHECHPLSDKIIEKMLKDYDADQNGLISYAEMWMINAEELERDTNLFHLNILKKLVPLDTNADGILTAAELEGLARAAFGVVDTNGDKVLSVEEYEEAKKAPQ